MAHRDTRPSSPRPDRAHEDERLDLELAMTFPASDPLPWIREPESPFEPLELYFDDLAVGQRFHTGSATLSESDIRHFASRYDPQPFHLDAEAASASLFGGLAASGWHTAAITMRLIVEGGMRLAGGIAGLGGQISWPRAVRPGDVLRVESEILDLRPSRSNPDRGLVTVRNTTSNQRNEAVQIAEMKLLVPRRGAPDGG